VDIAQWLRGLGLQSYEQAFRDNGIDFDVLPRLTADDLKEIGVLPVQSGASQKASYRGLLG
jgi:SAM domain (Sterile alpha motif)